MRQGAFQPIFSGKPDITAEPELERDVQSGGLGERTVGTNHLGITIGLTLGQRQIVPDVHPVRVVLVAKHKYLDFHQGLDHILSSSLFIHYPLPFDR